jgi:hypothetical protein
VTYRSDSWATISCPRSSSSSRPKLWRRSTPIRAPTCLPIFSSKGRSLGPVGVRLKGNNSFQPLSGKAALRVKINRFVRGARFSGLKNMTFNNMLQDESMMHEPMAYWAVRELGLPASRSNHALITINGESYGLYANIETVKREIIARWFDNHEGPLFDNSGKAGDFVASDIPNFSHRDGPDDRSLLLGLPRCLV